MTVKPAPREKNTGRKPPLGWMVRGLLGPSGTFLLAAAAATSWIALQENNASLALAEADGGQGMFEVPARSPLSAYARKALLERCLIEISSLRFPLHSREEQAALVSGCRRLSEENSAWSEADLILSRLSVMDGDIPAAEEFLFLAQDSARTDGWLALHRIRSFLKLPEPSAAQGPEDYDLSKDLAVLLAGHDHIEALARDLLREPELRETLLPAVEDLGPDAGQRFLSALYRAKETP